MDLIDYLAKFFLALSDFKTFLLLTAIGFIALQRRVWGQAFFILLFTMVLNTLLKNFFHVPLMPHLGKQGFAFPSGHMEAAVAFYGWLLLCYRNPFIRSLLLIVLTGIGFSLIYFRYHTLFDILGAVGFASLTLFIYYYFAKIPVLHKYPPLLGFGLCLLAVPILFYLKDIPPHVWIGFDALLGFSLVWAVLAKS